MPNNDDDIPAGCAWAIVLIAVIITSIITWHGERETMRYEAVKHGAAEYYLDQDQARQWRWKDEEPK